MQPKFSVVLIGRNEVKTLSRLIGSLDEFKHRGGEVIFVDTGSTDGTAELARDLGCHVEEVGDRFVKTITALEANAMNAEFVVENEPPVVKEGDRQFNYSAARNFAASFASNDMIATPDCDEIYTRLDIDKINDAIDAGIEQLEYNFVFSHDAEGGELIKFMHSKFYDRRRMKWVGIIHEVLQTIEPGASRKAKFFDESEIKLEHWQNPETDRGHYLTGLAFDCWHNPDNDRNAHYLGRELFYTYRVKSAIKQLKKHTEMPGWITEKSQSMIFIGKCYMILGDKDEAFKWYAKAFELEGGRREPLMEMANYYYEKGMVDQTIAYAAAALQIREGNFYANYRPYYEQLPHEMLYWALWQKQEAGDSYNHFMTCLGYQPFNPKYLHDMRYYIELPEISFVIPTLGRPEGLKRCLDSIKALNYPQEKIEIFVIHDGEPIPEWELELTQNDEHFYTGTSHGRRGVAKALNDGAKKSSGEWIVYASNDIEFEPDSIISAIKVYQDNHKPFIAFNTGEVGADGGNICEHFMLKRTVLDEVDLNGKIFDEDFHHVGVDNLLWAKMSKRGIAMRVGRAVVKHYHFSTTGQEMDETYKIGWDPESVEKDRALLVEKLKAI